MCVCVIIMRATKRNLKKLALINFLKKCRTCDRKNLFEFLSHDGVDVLGEIVHNLLFHKNSKLTKRTKNILKKRYGSKKKFMKILADKSKPVELRKKILIQEGSGGWGYILGLGLNLLNELIFGHK